MYKRQTQDISANLDPILGSGIVKANLATLANMVGIDYTTGDLIFADKLNSRAPGLHVFYFKGQNSYQFELFLDALMSAQNKKQQKDILWISSIGNQTTDTSLSTKPALLILPESKNKSVNKLTSHMDMQPTLIKRWLDCDIDVKHYSNGVDIKRLKKDRIIANTMDDGVVVFNKDKSMFVDQNGNFQSYSIQLAAPITAKADFPLMIDGVNFIKQFSKQVNKGQ